MHFYTLDKDKQTRLLAWWRVRTQPAPKRRKMISHPAFSSSQSDASALLADVLS